MNKLEIIKNKIKTKEELLREIARLQLKNNSIVFTNGCFDILHQGHVDYLANAANHGNILIVAVNTDDSVKRLGKAVSRPIQDEISRATIIASLHFVDLVVLFNEDTPLELIQSIRPDVLVKGADYDVNETNPQSKKYIVGSDVVKSYSGKVMAIPFLEGFSTTAIEKKIKNS